MSEQVDESVNFFLDLNLSGLNLTGTLSSDIHHLQSLVNLSLSSNNFDGPIPPEISLISGLIHETIVTVMVTDVTYLYSV
ncbi:putative non-specific serine/threonine protein kinase [Helianthus anomalus]